jgi:hypothetical protein
MTILTNYFQIEGQSYEHRVRILDKPLQEEDYFARIIKDQRKLEEMLDLDAKKFEGIIPEGLKYKERVLLADYPILLEEIGEKELILREATSYELTAWRRDPDNQRQSNPGTVLSVHGITVTSDRKLVYGSRGGQGNRVGLGEAAPGGNLSHKSFFETFRGEALEELKIASEELRDLRIVGVQTDPHFRPTVNIVFATEIPYSIGELKIFHTEAKRAIGDDRTITPKEARDLIAKAGLPNIDAWEKDYLVGLPLDIDSLSKHIDSKRIPGIENTTLSLLASSLGDLQIARELLKKGQI